MVTIKAVTRGLLVFGLAVVGLQLAATACGGGTATDENPAAVQATAVRRTAVAEVQRIIANKPAPTPTPQPTATAVPSCAGAIWWHEARAHLGEARTVQGRVVGIRP